MTSTATRFDLSSVIRHYNDTIAPLHEQYENTVNQGGQMRGTVGKLYETIAQGIVYAVDDSIVVKHNDYIMVESASGRYHKRVQVDLHLYKEGELIAVVECKTYLDSSMLDRACSEFEKIRRVHPGVPCAVFSGQFDVAQETYDWFSDECAFETFIVNTTKQRNASNPVFKSCDPLDEEALYSFARWVQSVVDNF